MELYIGILTTPTTFAIGAEGDSMAGDGIQCGNVVLLKKQEPRADEIVAVQVD